MNVFHKISPIRIQRKLATLAVPSLSALFVIAGFSMSTTSCLTTGKSAIALPRASTSAATSSSYAFTISKVLLDSNDPAGTFDIWDDGSSHTLGTLCVPPSSTDTTGKTTCQCVYNYSFTDQTTGTTSQQQKQVDTSYHEADQVRCPYVDIPASVGSVQVSLTVTSSNATSNAITYSFSNTTGLMDTSKAYNFQRIYRYTCREKIYVPDVMDPNSGIYDPFQSENTNTISYPISFYTSNLGASLNAYAGGSGSIVSNYECPADPLHPDSSYNETIYSQNQGTNGYYMMSGDVTGSTFDMNANNSRSTFYLSKSRTGIFNVPVNAYIAPTLLSIAPTGTTGSTPDPQGGGQPILGFGAMPRSTGTGTEDCPSDTPGDPNYVTIPSGYTWVKVWLFRGTIPQRHYLSGNNLQALGAIGCNPGKWPNDTHTNFYDWEIPDCQGLPGMTDATAGQTVARFSPFSAPGGIGICFDVQKQAYNDLFSNSNINNGAAVALSSTFLGTKLYADLWAPAGQATSFECGTTNLSALSEPPTSEVTGGLGVCAPSGYRAGGVGPTGFWAPTGATGTATSTTNVPPFDSSPTAVAISDPNATDSSGASYEFLYVVTPKTVMTGDMENSSSDTYARYAPMRFRSDADCGLTSPNPMGGKCLTNNLLRNYGLKLHDVGTNGDPPASDPNRAGVFPVCALQPLQPSGQPLP